MLRILHVDLISSQVLFKNKLVFSLDDFEKNGVERNIDPFFQELVKQAEMQTGRTRILNANNLVKNGFFHFFIGPTELFEQVPPRSIISGCATEIKTKRRPVLYRIENVLLP
jgi:hypothetical protein